MRIGIDARMMGAENTRGLGRYIQELIGAMVQIAPDNEYDLVARQADHALAGLPQIKTVVADIPWYGLTEQRRMPKILRDLKADVVHVPHWNVPLAYSGPLVVTIHDLLLLHQPNSANISTRTWPVRLAKGLGFRTTLKHAIKAARRICVPTEFVKNDIADFFPFASPKVVVTGEGMPTFAVVPAATGTELYLLYVGSAYPHKRLDLLLEAWRGLSAIHPKLSLMIAGEEDAFMLRIKELAVGLERINFLGRVSDAKLATLLGGALALVWPSSFEGFGLSPLEALSVGCPVVSSDAQPMPEVLGKNGIVYFKSGSADGMIQAVQKVVDNPSYYRTQALSAGPDLRARHSWSQAAKKTLAAYQDAARG